MIDPLLPFFVATAIIVVTGLCDSLIHSTWLSLILGLLLGPVVGLYFTEGLTLLVYLGIHRSLDAAKKHLRDDIAATETLVELGCRTVLILLVLVAILTIVGRRLSERHNGQDVKQRATVAR